MGWLGQVRHLIVGQRVQFLTAILHHGCVIQVAQDVALGA